MYLEEGEVSVEDQKLKCRVFGHRRRDRGIVKREKMQTERRFVDFGLCLVTYCAFWEEGEEEEV